MSLLERLSYFPELVRYGMHRLRRPGPRRLVMTLLVKNEMDILEANIRVHAGSGVDGFVVMDNGSTDGTRELLDQLGKDHDIAIIDQREQTYQQRQWMTWLARYARDRMGADWVISNDADEFWISDAGDLKQNLDPISAVTTCKRYNMALTEECLKPDYRFYESTYRVSHPILYPGEAQKSEEDIVIPLSKISDKVIVNPHGLTGLSGGNHRASHVTDLWQRDSFSSRIRVYHYPIRSYDQFRKNVQNRKQLTTMNERVNQGMHYKRWIRLLDQGGLEKEYERFILKRSEIPLLERVGIIRQDLRPRDVISSLLSNKNLPGAQQREQAAPAPDDQIL